MPIFDEALLREGLDLLGITASEEQIRSLRLYTLELEAWNSRMNLVGGTLSDFTVRHLLDCLSALPVLESLPHACIADIGSGAGLPGIPLAVAMPETEAVLIERSGKKAGFLRSSAAVLGLGRVRVIEKPYETVRERFQLVTCRAFAAISALLPAVRLMLEPGGAFAAYKGKREEVERELGEAGIAGRENVSVIELKVPYLNEQRHLVVIR
ncbi:MAG: 16S rRNA (guanine(527)-N(7))-methyltransferase RsmG [Spirochaetales bacterium]|nr:MAG: 16S rRNA (guanine(527)-N(7))-methyltransferase RsmG [Spirochaetales bacterium]